MKRIRKWLGSRNRLLTFRFRSIRQGKLIYWLVIFLISLAISGWSVESQVVRIPILGFHDIVDTQNPLDIPPHRPALSMDYTKQDLANFLEYLVQQNYWFLTSQDLYVYFINKSKPIPPQHLGQKPIMLTFDDGYKGVHTNGLPILEKLNFIYEEKVKFVLFVNPRFMGIDFGTDFLPHTTCNDLREGYQKGFYDIQSHGFNHRNLTKLNPKDLEFELAAAKLSLRKCTSDLDKNKMVAAHLAFPYGSTNETVEKILPKYYLSGFLYDDNFLRVNRFKDRYQISRIIVNRTMSVKQLVKLVNRASTLKKKKW